MDAVLPAVEPRRLSKKLSSKIKLAANKQQVIGLLRGKPVKVSQPHSQDLLIDGSKVSVSTQKYQVPPETTTVPDTSAVSLDRVPNLMF